jgi:hypothetical protein
MGEYEVKWLCSVGLDPAKLDIREFLTPE